MVREYIPTLEDQLQNINSDFVRMKQPKIELHKKILDKVLADVLKEFKKDSLFNKLFDKIFYGGSVFDNLKIRSPDEYDIDILLKLPKSYQPVIHNAIPGFVMIEITSYTARRLWKLERGSRALLSAPGVKSWFQSLVYKAVHNLQNNWNFSVRIRESGPAITLLITNKNPSSWFDVDLVPCIYFDKKDWPYGYRIHNSKYGFFAVPKCTSDDPSLWRLSFQLQERELIKDQKSLKPALRLMKALRDNQNLPLKSYFLKTIFLWERSIGFNFQNSSLAGTFSYMLRFLYYQMEREKIPYYWYPKFNLLTLHPDGCRNIANRLLRIISELQYTTEASVFFCRLVPESAILPGFGFEPEIEYPMFFGEKQPSWTWKGLFFKILLAFVIYSFFIAK